MQEAPRSASMSTAEMSDDIGGIMELQPILQLLEGKNKSWSDARSFAGIRVEVDGKHTRIISELFDTAKSSYVCFKEWRVLLGPQAKLRLMQAIGSCRTLRNIGVKDLTGNELEALLTPLQSNGVLDNLDIGPSCATEPTDGDACMERICKILGVILQTSRTFMYLHLELWRLTTAGVNHLASGLRGNDKSALRGLSLDLGESSTVKQIAEMVLSTRSLRALRLWSIGCLDDDGIDSLAYALAQSTSLESLELEHTRRGASALLLKALSGEGCNRSITSLGVYEVEECVGDCLPQLLLSNQSLKVLSWELNEEVLSPNQWRSLGQSLSSNSSLDLFEFLIRCSFSSGEDREVLDGVEDLFSAVEMDKACVELYVNAEFSPVSNPWNSRSQWRDAEALTGRQKKRIFALHLGAAGLSDPSKMWADLTKALNSRVIAISVLHLQMGRQMLGTKGRKLEHFFQALRDSSTLKILTIERGTSEYWPGGWKELIDCLHVNNSITHLRLIDCTGLDDDAFKRFMGVLRVNLTLKMVGLTGTSWEADGKKALIEEALRRNVVQASYFSVFTKIKLSFHPARNGRLFLCGSPFAGKTRLRHTMTSLLRGTSWLSDKTTQLWRTEGIQVELLKNDQEMQIAIWDLAGQWIFRTLQDILFPRTHHTSIFLFMFSPYDKENSCIKENLDLCFKSDLEEWLRFIASNTQLTGQMLPKVIVVMSHIDKMKDPDASWAQSILMELRKEYETILDIHSEQLYFLDVRRKGKVAPLKDFILQTFKKILSEKAPPTPRVCSHISSELAKRTKNIKYRPVWSSKEFYGFCYKSLQSDLNQYLTCESTSELEICEAIASYLHDIGSVIVIRGLDKIIVDPNWLTNTFLGELITLGHNFQVKHSSMQKSKLVSSKTGFVSSSDLQFLLSSFLEKHPKFKTLDKGVLEELLIHFDLCYKLVGGSVDARYYMPSIVCEDADFILLDNNIKTSTKAEHLEWSSPPERGQEFIGFRIQCDNPRRMSMTVALYPRFQIHIRDKLMTDMNLTEEDVICSRNYMHLCMDGHEVFIERSDMAKSHIDVMVKCSKYKSRETALRYIQDHIVDELHTFCASPKGCPGVALVVGVLRTECVKELVPMEYRGDTQVILIQNLKVNFEDYIMKRLKETTPESLQETRSESWSKSNGSVLQEMAPKSESKSNSSILNYEHSWPPIPQYLPGSFELVTKLLSESEVESVTGKVVEKHEQKMKKVDEISEQMSKEMDGGHDKSSLKMAVATEVGTSRITPVVTDPYYSSANAPTASYTSESTLERVLSRLNYLQHKVDESFHRMDEGFDHLEATLGRIERNMNQIISLQFQFQSSLSSFMSKVDRMIGYAESGEHFRTPKRPYLSFDNIGIFHKVTTWIRLGTPVRLHLMCESIAGPHVVKDQRGLELCLEKENMEWLRCIGHVSSKMLYYLGKAALHVTLGIGEVVSELDSLGVALPVAVASFAMEELEKDRNMVSLERSENMSMIEAWSHLRTTLTPHLQDNYAELFKLYRVKYSNVEEGYAWVCDQCMTRGIRSKSLACL